MQCMVISVASPCLVARNVLSHSGFQEHQSPWPNGSPKPRLPPMRSMTKSSNCVWQRRNVRLQCPKCHPNCKDWLKKICIMGHKLYILHHLYNPEMPSSKIIKIPKAIRQRTRPKDQSGRVYSQTTRCFSNQPK